MTKRRRSAVDVLGLARPTAERRRDLESIAQKLLRLPPGDDCIYALTGSLTPDEHAYVVERLFAARALADERALAADTVPASTWRPSWPHFAWLAITAVLLYYAGPSLLVIAAIVGVVILWVKFAQHFPLTAIAIMGFLSGLLRGGRR